MRTARRQAASTELHTIVQQTDARVREADDRYIAAHSGVNCKLCNSGPEVAFSMAFQPIVDVQRETVMAYEALARGATGGSAASVLDQTLHNNRYAIDQRCREKAIAVSAALGILNTGADLSVNFYPNAVYEPKQCLRRTLNAAEVVHFPLERIIFEITEVEEVRDHDHLRNIMAEYRTHGLRTAIDDFGAGHSGLKLLSSFQPDLIKLDHKLVERIHERPASRTIVRSIVQVCRDLGIQLIAEGVEHAEEMHVLCDLDIQLMQGYYFARPGFEQLPPWP